MKKLLVLGFIAISFSNVYALSESATKCKNKKGKVVKVDTTGDKTATNKEKKGSGL